MRLTEIYIELEELNGMKIIHSPHCGDFTNQVEFLTDHIGIIGVLSKRLNGEKIIGYG